MKFIQIPERGHEPVTVNISHIVQMYMTRANNETFTRVCLTAGNSYIDTPLTVDQVLNLIKGTAQ